MKDPYRTRVRPLVALRALRALLRDPDDTPRVFEVVDALTGASGRRLLERFRRAPTAARLLRERPDLRATLRDVAALRALPPGSLGRSYADFVSREQISADGLMQASRAVRDDVELSPWDEGQWLRERLRDMHDLWHVVTGYGRDLVGEGALVAFTFAQTRNPGFGLLLLGIYSRSGAMPDARRTLRQAWQRGRRAAWLPAQDWESLLARNLDELRRELALDPPPSYHPIRSLRAPALPSWAPALARSTHARRSSAPSGGHWPAVLAAEWARARGESSPNSSCRKLRIPAPRAPTLAQPPSMALPRPEPPTSCSWLHPAGRPQGTRARESAFGAP